VKSPVAAAGEEARAAAGSGRPCHADRCLKPIVTRPAIDDERRRSRRPPGGLRDPVPRRSKAPRGADHLARDASRAQSAPCSSQGCRRTARAARLLAAHQHQHRPHNSLRAYRAIKRRFFFEHQDGIALLKLVPTDEQEFQETLQSGQSGNAPLVRQIVLALNRFFEPDCAESERDRIQLWQSHRYDVRAPSTFVSFHALPHQHLRIEALKTAPWATAWLRPDQVDRRSFALVARSSGEQGHCSD